MKGKFKRCKYLGDKTGEEGICYCETQDPIGDPVRCVDVPHEECEYEPEV